MKTAVIDADSIPFICSKDDIKQSIDNVDSIIRTICKQTDSQQFILCLSQGPYFRLKYNKDYKGNRTGQSPLKWLKTLKNYLLEQYRCTMIQGLEADDLVGYIKSLNPKNNIICSTDKDVLQQLEGQHYNYKKHEWVNTNGPDSEYFLYKQTLMGDSTDNIKGIEGIGEKKAERILDLINIENQGLETVVKQYFKSYKGVEGYIQFYNNWKQVYILRDVEDLIIEGFEPSKIEIAVNQLV